LEGEGNLPKYQYKFNPCWITHLDFQTLVRTEWSRVEAPIGSTALHKHIFKMKTLKKGAFIWEKENKFRLKKDSLEIEEEIDEEIKIFYSSGSLAFIYVEDKKCLFEL